MSRVHVPSQWFPVLLLIILILSIALAVDVFTSRAGIVGQSPPCLSVLHNSCIHVEGNEILCWNAQCFIEVICFPTVPLTCGPEAAHSTPTWVLLRNNPRQVVHTHVPLSLSSISWYRPRGSDALRLRR